MQAHQQDKTLQSVTSSSRDTAPLNGEQERSSRGLADSLEAGEASLAPSQSPDHTERAAAMARDAVLEGPTDAAPEAVETSPEMSEAEAAQAYHGPLVAKVGEQLSEMAGRRTRIFKSRREKRAEKDASGILQTLSTLDSKTIGGVIETLQATQANDIQAFIKAFGVREVAVSYPREVRAVLAVLPAAQTFSFAKEHAKSSPAAAQLAYEVLPAGEQANLAREIPEIGAGAAQASMAAQRRMDPAKAAETDKNLRSGEEAYRASMVAAEKSESEKTQKAEDGAAASEGLVSQARAQMQAQQYPQVLGMLGHEADEPTRIAAVQRLEQEGHIVTLLEKLTFDQRWNEQPLAIRSLLQARSADANMAHALRYLEKEKSFWFWSKKKDLTAGEAYDALHMLRSLSPGHRAQFQRLHPERYARIEPYLTQSMREADDSNMANTEADQQTAADLTLKLSDAAFWETSPPLQIEMTLKSALRLGLRPQIKAQLESLEPAKLQALHADSDRRSAVEKALGTQSEQGSSGGDANAWLASLVTHKQVSEQGHQLKDGKYVTSSLGALWRANGASKRDAKAAQEKWDEANAAGKAEGERPADGNSMWSQLGAVLGKKKDLQVDNLALDEVQGAVDAFGGDIQFKDFGKRKGDNKDEDRNRADLKMNMSKGFMEFKCPHLELTKLRYPLGDMLVDMGPALMTNVYIRITWPTSHAPEQPSFIEVSSDSIELNEVFVTSPGMLVGLKKVEVSGFKFTNGEQAITLPDSAKLEDALKLVKEQNPARSLASWGLNFAGFGKLANQKTAGEDMESLIAATFTKPQGAMGGMTLASQEMTIQGITYNADTYVGEVKVGATNLVWDSRPSVVAGAHIKRLDKLIQDGESKLTSEGNAKGLEAQVAAWKTERDQLQAQKPAWESKEALYQRARQFSILPGAQNEALQNELLTQAQTLGIDLGEKADIKALTSALEADFARSSGIAASMDSVDVRDVDAMGMKVGSASATNISAHLSPDAVDGAMTGTPKSGHGGISIGSAKVENVQGMGISLGSGEIENAHVSGSLSQKSEAQLSVSSAKITDFQGYDAKVGEAQINDVSGKATLDRTTNGVAASADFSVGSVNASQVDAMGVNAGKVNADNIKLNGSVGNGQFQARGEVGSVTANDVVTGDTTIKEAGIKDVVLSAKGDRDRTEMSVNTGKIHGDIAQKGSASVNGQASVDGVSMHVDANAGIQDLAKGKLPSNTVLTLGVGAINLPQVSYASNGMAIGMGSAHVAPISAKASVQTREVKQSDGSLKQELASATIDWVRMPELTGKDLSLTLPVDGEMLRITLPQASIKGVNLENVNIPGFDSASLMNSTGRLSIASMQTSLSAKLGDSLKANASINVGNLHAEALSSGDISFGLKGLTLSQLGFEQSTSTQADDKSIVSQIVKLGGSASRIGQIDLSGRYNHKSGDLSTSISLGELSLSGIDYKASGTHLAVGNAALRNVVVSVDAKLNTSGSGDALKSLTLKELRVGSLSGSAISYKGTGKQIKRLEGGGTREVSTEMGVSLKRANISNVRVAGLPLIGATATKLSASIGSGNLDALSASLKEDGKNVLQANVSASVQNIGLDIIGDDLEATVGGFNGSFDATMGHGETATRVGGSDLQVGGVGHGATKVKVTDYADADKRNVSATVPYVQARGLHFAQGIRGFQQGAVGLGSAELRNIGVTSNKDKLVVDIGSGSGVMTGGVQADSNTQLITDRTPDRTETPANTVEWRALQPSMLNGHLNLRTPGGTPLINLNFKDNAPRIDLSGSRELLFDMWKNKLMGYGSASGLFSLLLDPKAPIRDTKLMLISQLVLFAVEKGFNLFSNKMVGLWPQVEQQMLSLLNQDASTKFIKGNDQASVNTLLGSMDKLIAGNLGPIVESVVDTGIIYDVIAGEHKRALETAGNWVTETVGNGIDWVGNQFGRENTVDFDDRARERQEVLRNERRREIYSFINARIEELMGWSLDADLSGKGAKYQALSQPNPNPQNKPKTQLMSTDLNLKLANKTSLRDFRLNGALNLQNFNFNQNGANVSVRNADVGASVNAGVSGTLGGGDKLGFTDIGAHAGGSLRVNFQGLRYEQRLSEEATQSPRLNVAPGNTPVSAPTVSSSSNATQPSVSSSAGGAQLLGDYRNRVVQGQNAELYGTYQRQYSQQRAAR